LLGSLTLAIILLFVGRLLITYDEAYTFNQPGGLIRQHKRGGVVQNTPFFISAHQN